MRLGNIDLLQLTPKKNDVVWLLAISRWSLPRTILLSWSLWKSRSSTHWRFLHILRSRWWQRFKWRKKQAVALPIKSALKIIASMDSYSYELTGRVNVKSHDCDGDCSQTKDLDCRWADKRSRSNHSIADPGLLVPNESILTTRRFSSSDNDLTTITQWATRITVMRARPVSRISGYSYKLLTPKSNSHTVALLKKRCLTSTIGFHTAVPVVSC